MYTFIITRTRKQIPKVLYYIQTSGHVLEIKVAKRYKHFE